MIVDMDFYSIIINFKINLPNKKQYVLFLTSLYVLVLYNVYGLRAKFKMGVSVGIHLRISCLAEVILSKLH